MRVTSRSFEVGNFVGEFWHSETIYYLPPFSRKLKSDFLIKKWPKICQRNKNVPHLEKSGSDSKVPLGFYKGSVLSEKVFSRSNFHGPGPTYEAKYIGDLFGFYWRNGKHSLRLEAEERESEKLTFALRKPVKLIWILFAFGVLVDSSWLIA